MSSEVGAAAGTPTIITVSNIGTDTAETECTANDVEIAIEEEEES